MLLKILSVSIFSDDQEKLIPYLMEKFQEYQPLILEFLSNMRKSNQSYAQFTFWYINFYTFHQLTISLRFFFTQVKTWLKNRHFINTIAKQKQVNKKTTFPLQNPRLFPRWFPRWCPKWDQCQWCTQWPCSVHHSVSSDRVFGLRCVLTNLSYSFT